MLKKERNISENVIWGNRKRFAGGKVSLAYSRFLGYDKGADGKLVINEEQAKTVKLIYKLFLDGLTMNYIANKLTKRKLRTPGGKYEKLGRFITVLKEQNELITEFDEPLWSSLAEKIIIKSKEEVRVVFKYGTEIRTQA